MWFTNKGGIVSTKLKKLLKNQDKVILYTKVSQDNQNSDNFIVNQNHKIFTLQNLKKKLHCGTRTLMTFLVKLHEKLCLIKLAFIQTVVKIRFKQTNKKFYEKGDFYT
jgi:hypothetical protein